MIVLDIGHNINLLFVGIAIAVSIILGIIVFLDNRKSITNQTFLLFAISAVFWNACNYISYQHMFVEQGLLIVRFTLFFAIWYCFYLFQLFYVFPESEYAFSKKFNTLLVPWVSLVAILTLTPLVFKGIAATDSDGVITNVIIGPAIPLFALTIIGLVTGGFMILIKKLKQSSVIKHMQLKTILIGAIISFTFHIIFNMIFPTFFDDSSFTPFGALFSLPFIAFTAYAIIKYKLFNVKVIATELLVFALWIFILMRTIVATSMNDRIINGLLLLVMIVVGLLLMRSVFKEVSQRERLQKLTIELENANEKLKGLDKLKTEFISLASHQLRSPLTAIKGYASMLLEGSFKQLEVPEQKAAIERIFQSSMNLARVVEDLLDVSKIEQGGMKYEMSSIDIKKLAKDIADELKVTAKNKGLQLDFEEKDLGGYVVKADPIKIRQAILNLVDNSIKYTQSGFVKVIATKPSSGKLRISITDSGMGISEENMGKLFEKFSRGDGGKVNAGGSGLGLYLVKEIVEAHGGKVWAESQGVGKGSTFIVELPEVAEAEHSS
jgi:signal transduction histidine kinase